MILFQFCSWQLNENSSDLDFLPTARSYNRRPWRSCHDPCHVQKRKIWLQRNVKQVTPQGLFHELCWKITIVESASSSSDDDYSPPPLSRAGRKLLFRRPSPTWLLSRMCLNTLLCSMSKHFPSKPWTFCTNIALTFSGTCREKQRRSRIQSEDRRRLAKHRSAQKRRGSRDCVIVQSIVTWVKTLCSIVYDLNMGCEYGDLWIK